MRMSRIFAGFVVLVALLVVAASAYGLTLQEFPTVPHPVEGAEDCLACHDLDQAYAFPEDHEGRGNELCLACHQVDVSESITPIPHTIEGREDCLVCHATGSVEPFPADHEGRESTSCLVCHQVGGEEATPVVGPTATLPPSIEVVPTPIHEPVMFEENSCISCHEELGGIHEQITGDWAASVHAQQGVGCVSCHGGDPTQEDAEDAMSPEAGYLGPLPKERIPGLCGSCHSRVDLMRPYGLPTDQFDQYWQSQHGQALLEGDTNVATCFDCHDGHRVLKTTDPASDVYPSNEPAMCAGCHSDESLMATYDLSADQFAMYQESVHGVALLEEQNLRAPTCSVCHGKHGAAPPGFQQVANVCGQCHATTEDYYKQGAHRTGMTGEAAPRCVTCHGIHEVMPATRELFVGTEAGRCASCHPAGSEANTQAEAMYQALTEADEAFEEAEDVIALATEKRLIMAEQEELLQRAQTPLIESRALQHTVDLEQIEAKAEESLTISQQVTASAEEALAGLDTRRLGMIISLAVILITIVALVLIKRELDRELEAKRARRT
ncbi:MAG: cytochrome c3 family protein [Anaerolineae bacterium]